MIPLPTIQAGHLSGHAEFSIRAILKAAKIPENVYAISTEIIAEATNSFLKDIYRIDEHQRGNISLSKFAGYWAFWIRKLKPVTFLERGWGTDINERISLQFAIALVIATRSSQRFSDQIWVDCSKTETAKCDGSKCFMMYTSEFLSYHENFMERDIIHSLRKRTFGPHHFALLIEQLMYSSCQLKHYNADQLKELNEPK